MRKLRVFLALLLVAPLAGAVQPYQAPTEGVELKLENFTKEKFLLAHLYTGNDTCNKPQDIGDVTRSVVTTVNADQVITLSLRGKRADITDPNACSVFFSFRAERGYSYRAALQVYGGVCRLGFSKVEQATNAQSSADRVLRTYKDYIIPTRGLCARPDAEQKTRLGL